MIGARIGDNLVFTGATLINPNGLALSAPGVSVGGRMFCGSSLDNPAGFTAQGEIRLVDAHIGGFLTFRGASLANPGGTALIASGLTVDQELVFGRQFRADGQVCLDYGRVKSLVCSGGTFTASDDGLALSAEGLVAAHEVRCTDGFTAAGEVTFRGARIGGQLTFDGATLTTPNPDRSTLNLQELDAHVLILRPQAPPRHVDLTHAHVRVLVDPKAAWPQSLGLWDFAYDVLSEHPKIDVTARLAWLERDPRGYAPQPYEQLAAVYRRAGRDEDARRVAIAKQRRRRRDRHLPGRAWGVLLDGLVGYGYRTWLGGLWLLGFLLVGWVVFARAYPAHMTPVNQPGVPLPRFQPFIYALDTLLPVVDLQQQDNWIPRGLAQWWAWVSILAGWVLTAAVAAALTGLIRKE
jgi:adhesin HecA-like repeat protein